MNISIIGLGLIGGSIARDLKSQIYVQVSGVDSNDNHCQMALDLGVVDQIISLEEAMDSSDVIIIAVPVDALQQLLPTILNQINDHQVLIDVGSTKKLICDAVRGHDKRGRFIAAHPLAGTEFSGPGAALKGLFVEKKNIVCESDLVQSDAMEIAMKIFDSLGMQTIFMDPSEHDKHLAYVSHLSHVSSFMLGMTVLDIERDEKQIFNLAGTGFASTVRLAKSNPKTWSAIFEKNNVHLSAALDQYILWLQKFKKAMDEGDRIAMESYMTSANDIKRVLNK
ncbi:MAG TPA: prephenate dehydrogenase [Saprospiraceae bacterium]|nr:prephenate dehydrogenase [Saprospiraceae bacterium]